MEIQPKDPSKNHFYASLIKSGLRIAAAFMLMSGDFASAGVMFIIAEAVGIVEELV